MISYKNNMNVFVLAKVMEMNEKERNNFVFEILYDIYFTSKRLYVKLIVYSMKLLQFYVDYVIIQIKH